MGHFIYYLSGVLCLWLPHFSFGAHCVGAKLSLGYVVRFTYQKSWKKSRCEEVVSDTMDAAASGGKWRRPTNHCHCSRAAEQERWWWQVCSAQCDQKGGILMTGGATVNKNYVDMNNNYVGGWRCSNVYIYYRLEYAG